MKGDRKRSNKGKTGKVVTQPLRPINQNEAALFQQLINISNQYAKLRGQYEEYTTILKAMKERRKKVANGEIKLPIMFPLGKNKYYNCDDKKYILKELDDEIGILSNALKGVEGQMQNHKDVYVETAFSVRDFIEEKFKNHKPKNVYSNGCSPNKKENVLFEAELDELAKDVVKQKEFHKAKQKAIKENSKQQG